MMDDIRTSYKRLKQKDEVYVPLRVNKYIRRG